MNNFAEIDMSAASGLNKDGMVMSEATASNKLSIRNLNFYYDRQCVLHDINLEIPEKQITALIGASGSGKSTLLRTFNLIYRLYPRQKAVGTVLFSGHNLLANDLSVTAIRHKIGMVFQKPTPFPMSVYKNITFAIKLYQRLNKADLNNRVEELLTQVGLWGEVKDRLTMAATRLSGGQQQRLCIARSLATDPEVLLLDEPTSALDPISTARIERLILKLKKKTTIVMVTHHLSQAKRISDNTVYLDHGHVIEHGLTESLFKSPQHKKTQAYLASYD